MEQRNRSECALDTFCVKMRFDERSEKKKIELISVQQCHQGCAVHDLIGFQINFSFVR